MQCLGDSDGDARSAAAEALACMRMLLGVKVFTALAGNEIMNDKQKSGKVDEAESKITAEIDARKTEHVCFHYLRFMLCLFCRRKMLPRLRLRMRYRSRRSRANHNCTMVTMYEANRNNYVRLMSLLL